MLDATTISTKKAKQEETLELPFPYNKQAYCRYEPIEKKIEHAKVLIVNDLLRYESDLSDVAKAELNGTVEQLLKFERHVSGLATNNIAQNVIRLVQHPKTLTVHLSEVADAAENFEPDAIVLSGTYSDFDYYNPEHLAKFEKFAKATKVPILGICGGHQLIGQTFGAELRTLDDLTPQEKRTGRKAEFQYRFVKITDTSDPIFAGIANGNSEEARVWQDYTLQDDILRVWQNHGLQVIGFPEGFEQLAKSYLCENQMMVKRSEGQLIYTVQFHLEKSFEDWSKNRTRWEHPNESRDGRILFENFLKLALLHKQN